MINLITSSGDPVDIDGEEQFGNLYIYLPLSGESIAKLCDASRKVEDDKVTYVELENLGVLLQGPDEHNPFYSGQEETLNLVFPFIEEGETFFEGFNTPDDEDYSEEQEGTSFTELTIESSGGVEKSTVAILSEGFSITLEMGKDGSVESYFIPKQFLLAADKVVNHPDATDIPNIINKMEYAPFKEILTAQLKGK